VELFTVSPDFHFGAIMPRPRTGQEFPCRACGALVYRRPSQFARGVKWTCGKSECKSIVFSGENNPFWGKTHSPEIREKIKAGRRARPPSGTGPKKGVFKQTLEARAKMSAALKERWRLNRDKMMSYIPRGDEHPYHKADREKRYRVCFTRFQKRDWQNDKCAYCEAVDDLVLDHIIPAMAGGKNVRSNAQTLCGPCNRWKMRYVDLPYYLATLGGEGGQI
jgi:5-methylcytosine-specific restriction endonuclease McrA